MILRLLAVWLVLFVGPVIAGRAAVPKPAKGWSMELVAQAPEVSHPSVVTTAPDGRVFVAEDPMDIREDVRPDAKAGRIWCLHPDGRRTLFAKDLHAVFGMQHLEGKLYVLHNPFLTVFRDDDGVGREPVDLLTHTLREPWGLGWNDHVPANFKLGMDGFFYLAVGDKGLEDCTGTDGRKISMPGGGVVRFRPDGSGLEIFATGVRNILDVALDEDDEPFTYDNTDEHQWMGRLTHMVEAGFYGYPHDFIPRRPYTLWMMHDFGAGAACGTLCATDDGLPAAMSGNLFLSDFGKRQVTRVTVVRDGASFRVAGSEELFPEPPDDFRPVGISWSVDGRSMFICDWQHRDQKADVSVGRLWKLTWTGGPEAKAWPKWWQGLAMGRPDTMEVAPPELVAALSHPARSVRLTAQRALVARARRPEGAVIAVRLGELLQDPGASGRARKHALWALDGIDEGVRGRPTVMALAAGADPSLAAQALRQLSQRRVAAAVPVAVRALKDAAAPVRLQAATLLGRTADTNSVPPLMASLGTETDGVVRFAVFTALRRIMEAHDETASAVVAGLASSSSKVREGCANALHDLCSVTAVARLARIVAGPDVAAAKAAMEVLAPLARRAPAVRDAWWAYHPADSPPPARTLDWAGTPSVVATLRTSLDHPDAAVRGLAVVALGDVGDTVSSGALRRRLAEDPVVAVRLSALASLAKIDPDGASDSAAAFLVTDAVPELRQAASRHRGDLAEAARGRRGSREAARPPRHGPRRGSIGSLGADRLGQGSRVARPRHPGPRRCAGPHRCAAAARGRGQSGSRGGAGFAEGTGEARCRRVARARETRGRDPGGRPWDAARCVQGRVRGQGLTAVREPAGSGPGGVRGVRQEPSRRSVARAADLLRCGRRRVQRLPPGRRSRRLGRSGPHLGGTPVRSARDHREHPLSGPDRPRRLSPDRDRHDRRP